MEEISQAFQLEHVLYGHLTYIGEQINITVYLYETKKNSKNEIYTNIGTLNEGLESRNNIFTTIIEKIDLTVSRNESINAARLGKTNFEAYEKFLKSGYNFNLRIPERTILQNSISRKR